MKTARAATPRRIQRKRTRGWKMPEGAVYVGRPTIFGNPFRDAISFRVWLSGFKGTGGGGLRRIALLSRIEELRGKDLVCWCSLDRACHADVLLEIANRDRKSVV